MVQLQIVACYYFKNQLWKGVSSRDMLLNKTCFYSGLLHAYAAVEHANAVLEHSSGFQPDKIFLFISGAFPTCLLSV